MTNVLVDASSLLPVAGTFDFSRKHLTTLSHTERLCLAQKLDFSGNEIVKMDGFYLLLSVEDLSLDDNSITILKGLSHLTHLKKLTLRNNSMPPRSYPWSFFFLISFSRKNQKLGRLLTWRTCSSPLDSWSHLTCGATRSPHCQTTKPPS